jgi:ABC-type tungstate transport system permease subunit
MQRAAKSLVTAYEVTFISRLGKVPTTIGTPLMHLRRSIHAEPHICSPHAFLSTLALGWALLAGGQALAQDKFIVMASTTSTEQSGLFSHLLPAFKQATGINVRVVALGTGQALDSARRGDADVVFVHDQAAEDKFVAEGFGVKRLPVMYNDFILIGPKGDPAGVRGKDINAALEEAGQRHAPASSRVATRAAPTLPNCATGRPPT